MLNFLSKSSQNVYRWETKDLCTNTSMYTFVFMYVFPKRDNHTRHPSSWYFRPGEKTGNVSKT